MEEIKIIYEDQYLAVISKPAGLSVHPGAGEGQFTLVDFLVKHYPNFLDHFKFKERAGIVHRLDKDTSGILLIAKDEKTKELLQNQFRNREVKKEYLALVLGEVKPEEGIIHTLISRNPQDRTKMKISLLKFPWEKAEKREAITRYSTEKLFTYIKDSRTKLTLVRVDLKTGRMHQIRAHFQYIGHPLIGDQVYTNRTSKQLSTELDLKRQFLHAAKITFTHPFTNQELSFESNLPPDLAKIFDNLS